MKTLAVCPPLPSLLIILLPCCWHFSAFHTPCCASLAMPVLSSHWVSICLFSATICFSPLPLCCLSLPPCLLYLSVPSFLSICLYFSSPLDCLYSNFSLVSQHFFGSLALGFLSLCVMLLPCIPLFSLVFFIPCDQFLCQLVFANPWPQCSSIFSSFSSLHKHIRSLCNTQNPSCFLCADTLTHV